MHVLGIILARAGSKGLPDKCVRPVLGRPMIEYTFDHALAATALNRVVLTTDSQPAKRLARARGVEVVDRPAALATDAARVDAAARHAVESFEAGGGGAVDAVVLLYANIPVRPEGIIDRAVDHLIAIGADSVRTVAPIGRHHPDWLHRLDGDRMRQFRENGIYRRQDLTPLFYHDGAVAAVTRAALFRETACADDGQAFLGADRRAIVLAPEDVVDVDTPLDVLVAEGVMRLRMVDPVNAT
ncbi:MAG: NTP transferase domain-containing protein [Phycisphaerales bacterium]|nr:NTP transferase domain-containing protein [Phycisphaerales bacterium]